MVRGEKKTRLRVIEQCDTEPLMLSKKDPSFFKIRNTHMCSEQNHYCQHQWKDFESTVAWHLTEYNWMISGADL